MSNKTCFVVMAIGEQTFGTEIISSESLKIKYDSLIKEAILKARPLLDVTRADEISRPGTITSDIIKRLMFSDFVVADVTYPNANVFYELGLRHACKAGTIIIRDSSGPRIPFDISQLRYIPYENTPVGLKLLSKDLSDSFSHFETNATLPDNHFLELAKLLHFEFPVYRKNDELPLAAQAMMELISSPGMMDILSQQDSGNIVPRSDILKVLSSNPKAMQLILQGMSDAGQLSFMESNVQPKKVPYRKK